MVAGRLEKHTKRLAGLGLTDITAKKFAVNEELSETTQAVLGTDSPQTAPDDGTTSSPLPGTARLRSARRGTHTSPPRAMGHPPQRVTPPIAIAAAGLSPCAMKQPVTRVLTQADEPLLRRATLENLNWAETRFTMRDVIDRRDSRTTSGWWWLAETSGSSPNGTNILAGSSGSSSCPLRTPATASSVTASPS